MRNSFFSPLRGAIFFLLLLAIGCQYDMKEIDGIEFSSDLAVPLINSKISVQEILDEEEDLSFLEIDSEGNIKFVYDDEATTKDLIELIGSETSFPLAVNNTSTTIPFNVFPNVAVRSLDLKDGFLAFELSSSHTEDVSVTITIPSLIKNGQPFQSTVLMTYMGTSPTTHIIDPVPITGYVLDIPDGNVKVNYNATLNNGIEVMINGISGEAQNWQIENLKGIWDQEVITLESSTVEVEIYDSWVDGDIYFEAPELSIVVENSFGFPTSVIVKSLQIITLDDEVLNLESDMVDNAFEINYPTLTEMGSSKQTTFTFNKENSNIRDLFNTKFKSIVYELEAMINPEDLNTMGFLADFSQLRTTVHAELPIYGSAKGFRMETDTEVEVDDLENIREAEFKLITDNGLPIEARIQFYFLDDQDNVIDSLFNSEINLLEAASVNGDGTVNQSSISTVLIPVSDDHLEWLRTYGKMRMGASISTTANGDVPVRLQSTQELEVKLGLKVGVE